MEEDDDLLRTARAAIRDLARGYRADDLAEDPRVTCERLSRALGESYDFDAGEVLEAGAGQSAPPVREGT
jgi:hypothetical protein